MKKLQTVLTGCILTAALLAAGGCNKQPSSSLSYQDILENGLGLSEAETVERYQIDESSVQKEERDSEEIWTLSEPEEIMGQSATVFLNFKDNSLTGASFVISIDNDQELVWKTLTDIYKDMEDNLGDPSTFIDNQQPFDRYTDYAAFSEAIAPELETGIYIEANNWEQEDDINGPRAHLLLTMFESGSSTIEQRVYLP